LFRAAYAGHTLLNYPTPFRTNSADKGKNMNACMSNKTRSIALLLALLCLLSCRGTYPEPRYYNPVHAQYENASTLGKDRAEISGHYTTNNILSHNSTPQYENANDFGQNVGFRLGYGFSEKVDLKVRYQHTRMPIVRFADNPDFNVENSRNYFFSLAPKISLKADELSLLIPLSFYDYSSTQPALSTSVFREKYFSIAPHLIKTFPVKVNRIDLSTAANMEVGFSKDGYGSNQFLVFTGFNLNAGFSRDLRRWAIRPELGYNIKLWDKTGVWNFGVGLQLTLPHKTKQKQ
jgi:hypothetical protein